MIIQPRPLEEAFSLLVFPDNIAVDANCRMHGSHLDPNESNPQGIKPHLKWFQEGLLVSVGTERSFFDLLFSDQTKCEGLVVRDTDPNIKAYVDFNVLLLRISKTRDEYLKLSTALPLTGYYSYQLASILQDRIKIIEKKIDESDLPEKIKSYYQKNCKIFGSIYLDARQDWRGRKAEDFKGCRYDQDEEDFLKLQGYAQAGNIIAVIGEINDLTFLEGRNITFVDTSNILDYEPLDIQTHQDFTPRIIWTDLTHEPAGYGASSTNILPRRSNRLPSG